MKATLLFLALAGAVLVAPPAAAQQTGAMTIAFESVETALSSEGPRLIVKGVVTLTADYTAYTGLSGIPVAYTLTEQPEWVAVTVSPATDIFPYPQTPSLSFTFSVSREITVTVDLADAPATDESAMVQVTGATTPSAGSKQIVGLGEIPLRFDAVEEPCDEALHAFLAPEAAAPEEPAEVVEVQGAASSPVRTSTLLVIGFALVGAGVGLALRRRFA